MQKTNKIFFDMVHPADVHQYKNVIHLLQKKGYDCFVFARKKDVTVDLLSQYSIKFKVISRAQKGLLLGFFELLFRTTIIFLYSIWYRPCILVASTGVSVGIVGRILQIPNVQFADTEGAYLQNRLSFPFATAIYTPAAYTTEIAKNHYRYQGYKELAYLHPRFFTPDTNRIISSGINPVKRYAVLRFVSFAAQHDRGVQGFSNKQKQELVEKLSQYGQVVISCEGQLPAELEKYRLLCKPWDLHHIIAGASLVCGESSTLASEAAVLGVPAVFVYGFTRGYTDEQGERYGLVNTFGTDTDAIHDAIACAVRIFIDTEAKVKATKGREKLLNDMIDVTEFMYNEIISHAKV